MAEPRDGSAYHGRTTGSTNVWQRMCHLVGYVAHNSEYDRGDGGKNCRYCDHSMDDEGTGRNMHAADCIVRTAQALEQDIMDAAQ